VILTASSSLLRASDALPWVTPIPPRIARGSHAAAVVGLVDFLNTEKGFVVITLVNPFEKAYV
jgi:hypothetical protein